MTRPTERSITVPTKLTRSEFVERLAQVSHRSWLRQKERDDGVPAGELSAEVTAHDRERAEDILRELERIGASGTTVGLDHSVPTQLTKSELVERLAQVSHRSWLRQKERDDGVPAGELSAEVTAHDRERAEDILRELEQIGVPGTVALDRFEAAGSPPDLAEQLEAYRRVLLRDARRVAKSHSWRWGHALARMANRIRLRHLRTKGALTDLIEQLEGTPIAAPAPLARKSWSGEGFNFSDPVSVVIPVHGATDSFERCLAALERNTSHPAELLLIDDASDDPRIMPILRSAAEHPKVTVLQNPRNLGFARTVNRGLEQTTGDIVILNSDTQVTPRWLENLRLAAYSAPDIGTATPLSNRSRTLSITAQLRSGDLATDDVGRLVTQASAWLLPTIPAGSGFCMYIKRRTLDAVGLLDADQFASYGEDTEFCLRAVARGWRSVLVDSVFVGHDGAASFGRRRAQLARRAERKISRLYPTYSERQRRFARSVEMERIRMRIARAAQPRVRPRPRVLLLPSVEGNDILGLELESELEPLQLQVDGGTFTLVRHDASGLAIMNTWVLVADSEERDRNGSRLEQIVVDMISRHAIEVIGLPDDHAAVEEFAQVATQLAPTVDLRDSDEPTAPRRALESALREHRTFAGLVNMPASGVTVASVDRATSG